MDEVNFFISVARACADQSTCISSRYGAVIVDPTTRTILATGYNGSPRGIDHCSDSGECFKRKFGFTHGNGWDFCVCSHAEQNALIQAGSKSWGCDLYLYGYRVTNDQEINPKPCFLCTKLIINAGIKRVVTNYMVLDPYELFYGYVSSMSTSKIFDP